MTSNKVVVTGFGPFGEHETNASWEAVKLLPELNMENVELIIKEIPVTYIDVENFVNKLWGEYSPTLVIHVGVNGKSSKIKLETIANRTGYNRADCIGKFHPTGTCCSVDSGEDCITCQIDIAQICKSLKNDFRVGVSADAGRYLCEFIFYKSLNINRHQTMFVHVPPLNKPYTAKELALAIKKIIESALQQINKIG